IIELVKTRIPRRFGLDPIRDIQVLCPMNRGGVGARSLNIELQAALNPAGDQKIERFGWAPNLIKFDWGPAPYPPTTAAMFETVAASFNPAHQDSRLKDEGNVEAALTGASVIQAEYKVPHLAHAPLEPMNVVVQLKDGRLDIWTGTQIPLFLIAG